MKDTNMTKQQIIALLRREELKTFRNGK